MGVNSCIEQISIFVLNSCNELLKFIYMIQVMIQKCKLYEYKLKAPIIVFTL